MSRPRIAAALLLIPSLLVPPAAGAITPEEMQPHRQTVAEMDAVGDAILAWITDQTALRAGWATGGRLAGAGTFDLGDYPPITVSGLETLLVPTYISAVPAVDGWGNPYEYRLDVGDPFGAEVALIRSTGEDGVFEGTAYSAGDTELLAEDLVWADGAQVRRPGPALLDLASRQDRATREVRGISTAMLTWVVDVLLLPPSAVGGAVDLDLFTPITPTALEALLVPNYLLFLPSADPWGNPYDLWLDVGDLNGPELLAVRSRGRFGAAEGSVYTPGTFPATELDRDTVWADGVAVRSPDGSLVFAADFEVGDARHWSSGSL